MALCHTCGAELKSESSCTACILALGLMAGQADDEPAFEIDRYRLLEKIGEGGMGEVWLAEQTEPVRRRVAVKVLKSGVGSREVIARFASEQQAMALMDHPAIARVFDAGTTSHGAPYFAMEYVDGVPMTEYAARHGLEIRQRLELFLLVCQGVQYAHQKAIIHRDLKPTNILVTETDGRAAPKIIDFGIAKALAQKLTADTLYTRAGALVGTPEYMSPEQASSMGQDIDTRTDVYSLGIVFYELLTGVLPLDSHSASGRDMPFDEFLRRLREDDVRRPSAMVPGTDPRAKELRGDLDSIALKALEKDRTRRYGSPTEFAADIKRYLEHEAVLAMPPSVAYRAGKFARRYRAALATAVAFVLVLIAATAISVRQSVRANQAAAAAQAVNDFLQNDLLAQASASNQGGGGAKPDPDLKVRTALDRAAVRSAGKFGRQPEVEAAIRDTMGQTYMDLGLYPEAQKQLERARDLHQRALGEENPKTLWSMSRLGRVDQLQGKYSEAEPLLIRAAEVERRVLGVEHPDTLYSMNVLALCYKFEGKFAKAEVLQRPTLEIMRRVLGPEHPATLMALNNLGALYTALGKYREAEVLDSQILEIRRRKLGPEHPDTLYSMTNLGDDYLIEGRYGEAEALLGPLVETERRLLGTEHSGTLHSVNFLALVYYAQGKYRQAETLHSQTLEIMRRLLGPERLDSLLLMSNLAADYHAQGKFARAEALLSEALRIETRVLTPEHPVALYTRADFAGMYQAWGKYDLAESYAAQTLQGRRHLVGSEHPDTMQSAADLALAYLSQGKFAQSEPLAREALAFERRAQPDGWHLSRDEVLLGLSLAGQKKSAEAEPLLQEGFRGLTERKKLIPAPDDHSVNQVREQIFKLYEARGMRDRAAAWQKQ